MTIGFKPALVLITLIWSTLFGLTTHTVLAAEQSGENCSCICEGPIAAEETTVTYSSKIKLSEVYPAPNTDEEEFIELYNSGSSPADLAGWKLADASGKTYTISTEDFVTTEIAANGYFIVPHSISKIYLNNSDDTVLLYQPDDALLDETSYEETEKGLSWSLVNNHWAWTTQSTEGEDNVASSNEKTESGQDSTDNNDSSEDSTNKDDVYQTSDSIFLSELLPNPTGVDSTDEWIEIVNLGSDAINLTGWQLTDASKYYTVDNVTLTAGEYLVFEVGVTGISLNNTGDTIYLIDPFGTIINGTEYIDCEEGYSWALINNEWQWTDQLTPGEENKPSAESPNDEDEKQDETQDNNEAEQDTDVISISLLRSMEDGQSATIQGVVTVIPGTFGSQYFYIQDNEAGIQVYSYSKAFPELLVGDLVQVTGEKSTTRGETRIKTKAQEDIVITAQNQEVAPREASILEESLEGLLVQVDGEIMESSSSDAIINDLTKIVMKSAANIDSSLLEEGASVAVLGVVGQYDEEYRLMPRSNDDITEIEADNVAWINPAEAATTNPSSLNSTNNQDQSKTLLVVVIVGLLAIISGVAFRHKKEQLQTMFAGIKQQKGASIKNDNKKDEIAELFKLKNE